MQPLRYRSIFVSDVHLGTRDARVEYLLDFLDHVECDYLFLAGDIFDIWKMRSNRWHWPLINNRLLQRFMAFAANGTQVVYVPGNHDEFFRDYIDADMGGVKVCRDYRHLLADGREVLVLHGDEFDTVVRHSRLLKFIGNAGYEVLMWVNRASHRIRRWFGRGYWSLSLAIKQQVPNARVYIQKFEDAAIRHARDQGVDAIVCGHIHHANLRTENGVTYANSGDWVEHCTALVEQQDGQLELVRWVQESTARLDARLPAPVATEDAQPEATSRA